MPGVIQHLLTPPDSPDPVRSRVSPHLLAVTADVAFYAAVLGAGTDSHWRTDWARSLRRAVEACTVKAVPVVMYDTNLPGIDWRWALDCFAATAHPPRVVVAAASVDEDLWSHVLERHGYDVVERSAGPDNLRRILHFAWLSL
jgi:CheY-like chemotaxis protein